MRAVKSFEFQRWKSSRTFGVFGTSHARRLRRPAFSTRISVP